MAGNKNQNDFQARLARLDGGAKRPEATVEKPAENQPDFRPKQKNTNIIRRIQILGSAFLVLVLAGVFLFNAFGAQWSAKISKVGDDMALVAKATGVVMSGSGYTMGSNANAADIPVLEQTDHGLIARSPVVLGASDKPISELFADYTPEPSGARPSAIIQFDSGETCEPRRPTSNELVMGVHLDSSEMPTPLQIVQNQKIVASILGGLKNSTKHRRAVRLGPKEEWRSEYTQLRPVNGTAMRSVDVLVTETSAPVYLVLQTIGGHNIWNLHLAPGVEIAHVVMISASNVGLSGLPDGATYESMRIGDFVTPNSHGDDDVERDCMIRPWRKPQANWIAWQKAQKNNQIYVFQMESFTQGFAAYDRWYRGAFGAEAGLNTVTANSAAHVLLGPVPTEKMTFHTIGNSELLVERADHIFAGDPAAQIANAARLQSEVLHAAMGSDLDQLWPEPMTGDSQ